MGTSSQVKASRTNVIHTVDSYVNNCKLHTLAILLFVLVTCLILIKSYNSTHDINSYYDYYILTHYNDDAPYTTDTNNTNNRRIRINHSDEHMRYNNLLSIQTKLSTVQSLNLCPVNHMSDSGIFDGTIERYPSVYIHNLAGTIQIYEAEYVAQDNILRMVVSGYQDELKYVHNYGWRSPDFIISQLKQLHQLSDRSITCNYMDTSGNKYTSYGKFNVHGIGDGNTVQIAYLDCPIVFDTDTVFKQLDSLTDDDAMELETMNYNEYQSKLSEFSTLQLTVTINTPCSNNVIHNTGCWGTPTNTKSSLPDKLTVESVNIDQCSTAAHNNGYKYFVFADQSCFGGMDNYDRGGPMFCASQCSDPLAGLCGYTYSVNDNKYCHEQQKLQHKVNMADVIETTQLKLNLCRYTDNNKLMTALHKSLYTPLSTHDIETWIDYHSFIGIDRIIIRDRYGDYRNITQKYTIHGTKYNPNTQVIWRPTPLPNKVNERSIQLSWNKEVIWAVDQVVLVNADLFRYRASSEWMTAIDIDEYLAIVVTSDSIQPPSCHQGECNSMLSKFLSNDIYTADDIVGIALYSLYYHNKGDQPSIHSLITTNTYWADSTPIRFPYRKSEVPPFDRIKWIAHPKLIHHAFHHRIQYNTSLYHEINVPYQYDTPINVAEPTADINTIDCTQHIHDCIRTAHYADSFGSRLWPLNKFENGANVLDYSIIDIVQYMIQHHHTAAIDSVDQTKSNPLQRYDTSH